MEGAAREKAARAAALSAGGRLGKAFRLAVVSTECPPSRQTSAAAGKPKANRAVSPMAEGREGGHRSEWRACSLASLGCCVRLLGFAQQKSTWQPRAAMAAGPERPGVTFARNAGNGNAGREGGPRDRTTGTHFCERVSTGCGKKKNCSTKLEKGFPPAAGKRITLPLLGAAGRQRKSLV